MTDDHSYQTISAYGHALGKLAPTPNLDRLAAEGMLFRQAFVENSLSTPSRACLMTGLYSHQNGQRQLGKGIDTTKVFFSEIPEGIFGKWIVKTNHEGNPTNALIVQGIVVSVLLIIPALGIGNMDSFLQMLINMTAATSLLPVLLLLIGYIVLRWKKTIWIEA